MTTLHRVTDITRKIFIGFGIGILAIIFLVILFNIGSAIKQLLFPTPPPPPTVAFGKLGEFSFPKSPINQQFSYTLNTVSGTLPTFEDRVTVYKLEQPHPNLLALDNVKSIAAKAGFTGEGTPLSETLFSWQDTTTGQKIVINSLTFDIIYSLENYFSNQQVLAATFLGDQNHAIDTAKTFLQTISTVPADIDTSKTTTTLYSIKEGALIPATSLSNAQIIQVDYFQKDINELPIFYPNATHSLLTFLIGSGEHDTQVVNAHIVHRGVLTDFNATYPLKSPQQAFDELKKGKAYIAQYNGTKSSIIIRNISLGYYIGEDPQLYLMPIIIFQGDDNFYAYVTAITDEWLGK